MTRVGKTANQIMNAIWCLDGGGTGVDVGGVRLGDMLGNSLGAGGWG